MPLNTQTKQQLKAKAHKLKPVVLVSHQGLSEAVKKEIDRALHDHELIKIRIQSLDREERNHLFHAISETLNAELVQVIGRIGIFFRQQSK